MATKEQKLARELLREMLAEPGTSQRKLAKRLGVTQAAVSYVVTGTGEVGLPILKGLARLRPEQAPALLGAAAHGSHTSPGYTDHVTASRDLAERYYLTLNPEADRHLVKEVFDWILIAHEDDDQPHDVEWWLGQFRTMHIKRIRMLEARVTTTPDEH
jgi:transcriptional regulator with XRE-family HTH domain